MTLYACVYPYPSLDPRVAPSTRPRLVAALAVSALAHAAICAVISGGAYRTAAVPPAGTVLAARLVMAIEPIEPRVPEVPPAYAPMPSETLSAERVGRISARAAPALAPARDKATSDSAAIDAPDPTYYAAKQLDVYPALSQPLDLRYGGKAAEHGVSGRALLLVLIDEIGTVRQVSVVEAQPAGYFEDDAKRSFMDARFSPAYRDGRPVRSRVLVEVNYGLERASP